MTDIAMSAITEGERYRHDLGDIKSLAESMTEVGLLHPVVVTADMRLIAGGRRLAAARSLGWTEIPATVVTNIAEADAILQAESDENTCRKDFTPTEALAIKQAREALLRPIAKANQGQPGADRSHKLDERSLVRTDRVAARGTGFSASTLRKVEQVKRTADAADTPEPVREVAKAALVEMDRTGNVDRAHKSVTKVIAAESPAAIGQAARREYLSSPWPVFTLKLLGDLKRWGDWLQLDEVGGPDGLIESLNESLLPGCADDAARALEQLDSAVAWIDSIRDALGVAARAQLRSVR